MGPFQLQAAIQGVHCAAPAFEDTDWPTIVRLYDRLLRLMPTPVVTLNRAIAVAETEGPAAALDLVDTMAADLDGYHLLHATRATLLEKLGRTAEAAEAYGRAAELASTAPDVNFMSRRRDELTAAD